MAPNKPYTTDLNAAISDAERMLSRLGRGYVVVVLYHKKTKKFDVEGAERGRSIYRKGWMRVCTFSGTALV